jgi:hypothetical protein
VTCEAVRRPDAAERFPLSRAGARAGNGLDVRACRCVDVAAKKPAKLPCPWLSVMAGCHRREPLLQHAGRRLFLSFPIVRRQGRPVRACLTTCQSQRSSKGG